MITKLGLGHIHRRGRTGSGKRYPLGENKSWLCFDEISETHVDLCARGAGMEKHFGRRVLSSQESGRSGIHRTADCVQKKAGW